MLLVQYSTESSVHAMSLCGSKHHQLLMEEAAFPWSPIECRQMLILYKHESFASQFVKEMLWFSCFFWGIYRLPSGACRRGISTQVKVDMPYCPPFKVVEFFSLICTQRRTSAEQKMTMLMMWLILYYTALCRPPQHPHFTPHLWQAVNGQ